MIVEEKARVRRALVTGAGSGIGEAVVRVLERDGYEVIGFDVVPSEEPGRWFAGDVSNPEDVRRALVSVSALDVVVHAAAIGHVGTVEDVSLEELDELHRVNVRGTVVICQAAIPLMRKSGGGSIVLIGSVLANVGAPMRAAYSATKGAVLALGRQMAVDYVTENIRVNIVCPGTVDTPWIQRVLASATDPISELERLENRQPMGRLARPEEIGELALFLASDRSSFMTGSMVTIDGGYSAI